MSGQLANADLLNWVRRAAAHEMDARFQLTLLHVTEEIVEATDGKRLHQVHQTFGLQPGLYDFGLLLPVNVDLVYPGTSKITILHDGSPASHVLRELETFKAVVAGAKEAWSRSFADPLMGVGLPAADATTAWFDPRLLWDAIEPFGGVDYRLQGRNLPLRLDLREGPVEAEVVATAVVMPIRVEQDPSAWFDLGRLVGRQEPDPAPPPAEAGERHDA